MKKSLIVRWIIIAAVVLGWLYSIFPVKDGDILTEFQKHADARIAALQNQAKQLEAAGGKDAVRRQMQGIADSTTAEYIRLKGIYYAPDKLASFETLKSRIADIQKATPELDHYMVLKNAADQSPRIPLTDYVEISGNTRYSNANVMRYLRRRVAGHLTLGLDLQGGTEFIVGFDEDEVLAKDPKANIEWIRDQIRTILDNRLNGIGVTEPEIRVEGTSSISVKMPAVSEGNKASIRETIQKSARLSFHLVTPTDETGKTYAMKELPMISRNEDGEEADLMTQVRVEPTTVLGSDIIQALPQQNQYGRWAVGLRFNEEGAKQFGIVTGANISQQLAIVLDGKVYSAPVIQGAITGGSAEITGDFTYEEARQLATVISSGNLPTDISIKSEFGTDPTLGADSIRSGCLAGLIGLALVVVFMVWYYHVPGLIAVLALIVNTILTLGTMALLKATITMPGIAGMVLTIGMAVDANVLIFERIREELNKQKTLGNAVKSGYERAFSSIFDSNLTTLVTCWCLYEFGSGAIKGFAVTLSCGIVASMFTAIYMTRAVFDFLLYKGWLKSLSMHSFQCFRNPHVDFLKYRKIALHCSILCCVIGLATLFVRGNGMLGIEFAGGTQLSFSVGEPAKAPAVEAIRNALKAFKGFDNAQVSYKKGEGSLQVLEITIPENSKSRTAEETAAIKAAEAEVVKATRAFDTAEANLTTAKDTLTANQKTLADAEKALADAKDDAAKATAQKAVTAAKAEVATATAAVTTAEKAAENAIAARRVQEQNLARLEGRVNPEEILVALQKGNEAANLGFGGTKTVGAHVGAQFRIDALWAAISSLICVIIYLAFRFELKYGLAAVIAVTHDAIVAGGFFFLFGGRLTPSVVAAIMTIIGYSLNDTIVIFDRLREIKTLYKELRFYELVNLAINQTLSRTIITTITTVLAVASIMILSGGDVQDFAIVMFIGLFVGTYSTIFIATAFINTWTKKAEHRNNRIAAGK